jgi:hypothetical protein
VAVLGELFPIVRGEGWSRRQNIAALRAAVLKSGPEFLSRLVVAAGVDRRRILSSQAFLFF